MSNNYHIPSTAERLAVFLILLCFCAVFFIGVVTVATTVGGVLSGFIPLIKDTLNGWGPL